MYKIMYNNLVRFKKKTWNPYNTSQTSYSKNLLLMHFFTPSKFGKWDSIDLISKYKEAAVRFKTSWFLFASILFKKGCKLVKI